MADTDFFKLSMNTTTPLRSESNLEDESPQKRCHRDYSMSLSFAR